MEKLRCVKKTKLMCANCVQLQIALEGEQYSDTVD